MGSTSSILIAPLIYKNAGYTAATFAPIARVAETTEMLALFVQDGVYDAFAKKFARAKRSTWSRSVRS